MKYKTNNLGIHKKRVIILKLRPKVKVKQTEVMNLCDTLSHSHLPNMV